MLGSVHDEHGDTEDANQSYRRYLALCPNCRYAKDVRLVLKTRGLR